MAVLLPIGILSIVAILTVPFMVFTQATPIVDILVVSNVFTLALAKLWEARAKCRLALMKKSLQGLVNR